MKKIKSSLWSRAPKLLSTAINLTRLKDVDSVVNNLSELKGIPQKIGQMISMDFSEYLPDEYRDKFKKLQGNSQAIESDKILEIIKNDLGDNKFSQILNFNPEPLGAGSIGQVHLAEILNQKIVFKVRYPDIEKTLNNDLALMMPLVKTYEFFRPKSKDLTILLNEAKIMLMQEMNYEMEASFLKIFRKSLEQDNRFIIPNVIDDYSSRNIVCMEYHQGISLKDFIAKEKDSAQSLKVAQSLLELFIYEFFFMGMVQTDPNFSNYLIKDDCQIVLLDFGATKEFTKQFRDQYYLMLKASYAKNTKEILNIGEKLGLVDRTDNLEAVQIFIDFMIDVMSFFRPENNPLDFSNEKITKKLLDSGWELWKKQRISTPNSNLVFLHRKLGGLFSLLKESKLTIDLYPMWIKIINLNNE